MELNLSMVSAINCYIFGSIAIFLNILLIYVLHKHSLNGIGTFKYLMSTSAALDASFSVMCIVASPTFLAVDKMNSVLIVKNGFLLPTMLGRISLVVFLFLLCQSIVTPACLFVFRYLQICRPKILACYNKSLRYLLIIPLLISTSTCGLMCLASWPSVFDRKQFESFVTNFTEATGQGFLIATLSLNGDNYDDIQSIIMYTDAVLLSFSMLFSLFIMIYCTKSIAHTLLQITSSNARRLQIQLYKTLILQFSVPFIFIHIPFYLCILAPLIDLTSGLFTIFLPYLFAWCPVINPLIVLLFIGEYRRYVINRILFFGRSGSSQINSNSDVIFTSARRRQDV